MNEEDLKDPITGNPAISVAVIMGAYLVYTVLYLVLTWNTDAKAKTKKCLCECSIKKPLTSRRY